MKHETFIEVEIQKSHLDRPRVRGPLKEALCIISSLTDRTGLFLESRAVYLMKIHTRLP